MSKPAKSGWMAIGKFAPIHFFYKGQFIRAKMMSTENFGKNKGQSVLNFLDVRARRWGKK